MASNRRSSRLSPAGLDCCVPGAITREAIESALGSPIVSAGGSNTAPNAPGQLASHYAPNADLRLGAAEARADEAALDFGGLLKESAAGARLDLSPSGDLVEAASHLFSYLRALDAGGSARIAVAPIPEAWARGGDQRPAPAGGRAQDGLVLLVKPVFFRLWRVEQ